MGLAIFVNDQAREYVISAGGTQNLYDYATDAFLVLAGTTGEYQYRGLRSIDNHIDSHYRIVSVGHSLGGYLGASIARHIDEAITFESSGSGSIIGSLLTLICLKSDANITNILAGSDGINVNSLVEMLGFKSGTNIVLPNAVEHSIESLDVAIKYARAFGSFYGTDRLEDVSVLDEAPFRWR